MSNTIILEKLEIIHFKGVDHKKISFDPVCTNIWGDNGTGKTTIADAFSWLLFGKNSAGEADFGIKPFNTDGSKMQNVEIEVNGVINFNGRSIVLRHLFREIWSTTRGSDTREFKGNTNDYFIDGAPYTPTEYAAYVGRLVDEKVFKLITNPLYFNNEKLVPWQKRREFLMKMAGQLSNDELVAINPDFQKLIDRLINGKTIDKLKSEFNVEVKNAKDELEKIPTRIDEIRRNMPEAEDYDAIRQEIADKKARYETLGEQLDSVTAKAAGFTEKVQQHEAKVREVKSQRNAIAARIKEDRTKADLDEGKELRAKKTALTVAEQDVTTAQNSIDTHQAKIEQANRNITNGVKRIEAIDRELEAAKSEWKEINASKFEIKPEDTTCSHCGQQLPDEDRSTLIADLKKKFDDDRASKLNRNIERGKSLSQEKEGLVKQIAVFTNEVITLGNVLIARQQEHALHSETYDTMVDEIRRLEAEPTQEKEPVEDAIARDKEYQSLGEKLAALEAQAPKEEDDGMEAVREERKRLGNEMIALKVRLEVKEQREKAEARILELKKQETDLAQAQARSEGMLNLLTKFIKVQMDTVTDRINGKFKIVKFKMFNYLQNGGVEDTCETTVNGVPYSDLNSAARINAGIDVINVLSDHYEVKAPIVIDNRETIVKLLDTDSQVINLYVWENAKQLTVSKTPPQFDNSRVRQAQAALEM